MGTLTITAGGPFELASPRQFEVNAGQVLVVLAGDQTSDERYSVCELRLSIDEANGVLADLSDGSVTLRVAPEKGGRW